MQHTVLASAAFALLSYAAAHWLTHDFQVWTTEGARRLEVALHPVPAPYVAMDSPGVPGRTLAGLLSDEGAVTIVDFMYTRCITICAALGGAFQQMQSAIARVERTPGTAPLRLLSISFDPEHDDTAALATYAARLRADPHIWRFARVADVTSLRGVLERYQVTVIPDGLGGYEHNAALQVVDPTGWLVRVFDYAELDTALSFAGALAGAGTPQ